jgi:hypothetical protein
MLNDNAAQLKEHLKNLHADGDIKNLLDKPGADDDADPEESVTYGLAERSQELTARFAAQHPKLEPALRELGNMLSNMGI